MTDSVPFRGIMKALWPNTVKWAPKGTQALRTPSGNEIYQIKAKSKSDLSDEVGLIVMLLVMITK